MEQVKTAAIVLAAGHGKRMHSKVAKQYLLLKGEPVVVHALRAYKKGAEYSAPFLGTISKLKGFYFVELEIYPLSIGVIPVSLIACTSACVYQQDGYCRLERASSCGVPCAESPCVNFVPRRNCGTTATPTKARPAPHGCCGPE